jgi:hypothetical protein
MKSGKEGSFEQDPQKNNQTVYAGKSGSAFMQWNPLLKPMARLQTNTTGVTTMKKFSSSILSKSEGENSTIKSSDREQI